MSCLLELLVTTLFFSTTSAVLQVTSTPSSPNDSSLASKSNLTSRAQVFHIEEPKKSQHDEVTVRVEYETAKVNETTDCKRLVNELDRSSSADIGTDLASSAVNDEKSRLSTKEVANSLTNFSDNVEPQDDVIDKSFPTIIPPDVQWLLASLDKIDPQNLNIIVPSDHTEVNIHAFEDLPTDNWKNSLGTVQSSSGDQVPFLQETEQQYVDERDSKDISLPIYRNDITSVFRGLGQEIFSVPQKLIRGFTNTLNFPDIFSNEGSTGPDYRRTGAPSEQSQIYEGKSFYGNTYGKVHRNNYGSSRAGSSGGQNQFFLPPHLSPSTRFQFNRRPPLPSATSNQGNAQFGFPQTSLSPYLPFQFEKTKNYVYHDDLPGEEGLYLTPSLAYRQTHSNYRSPLGRYPTTSANIPIPYNLENVVDASVTVNRGATLNPASQAAYDLKNVLRRLNVQRRPKPNYLYRQLNPYASTSQNNYESSNDLSENLFYPQTNLEDETSFAPFGQFRFHNEPTHDPRNGISKTNFRVKRRPYNLLGLKNLPKVGLQEESYIRGKRVKRSPFLDVASKLVTDFSEPIKQILPELAVAVPDLVSLSFDAPKVIEKGNLNLGRSGQIDLKELADELMHENMFASDIENGVRLVRQIDTHELSQIDSGTIDLPGGIPLNLGPLETLFPTNNVKRVLQKIKENVLFTHLTNLNDDSHKMITKNQNEKTNLEITTKPELEKSELENPEKKANQFTETNATNETTIKIETANESTVENARKSSNTGTTAKLMNDANINKTEITENSDILNSETNKKPEFHDHVHEINESQDYKTAKNEKGGLSDKYGRERRSYNEDGCRCNNQSQQPLQRSSPPVITEQDRVLLETLLVQYINQLNSTIAATTKPNTLATENIIKSYRDVDSKTNVTNIKTKKDGYGRKSDDSEVSTTTNYEDVGKAADDVITPDIKTTTETGNVERKTVYIVPEPIVHEETTTNKYLDIVMNHNNTESIVDEPLTKNNGTVYSETNSYFTVIDEHQSEHVTRGATSGEDSSQRKGNDLEVESSTYYANAGITTEEVFKTAHDIEEENIESSTVSIYAEPIVNEETQTETNIDVVTNRNHTESIVDEQLRKNNSTVYSETNSYLNVIDEEQSEHVTRVAKTEEDLNQRKGSDLKVESTTYRANAGNTTEEVDKITRDIKNFTYADNVQSSTVSVSIDAEPKVNEETKTDKNIAVFTNGNHTESIIDELLKKTNSTVYSETNSYLNVLDEDQSEHVTAKSEELLNQRKGNDLEVESTKYQANVETTTGEVDKITRDMKKPTEAGNVENSTVSKESEPIVDVETKTDKHVDVVTKANHSKSTVDELLTKNQRTSYSGTNDYLPVIDEDQSENKASEHKQDLVEIEENITRRQKKDKFGTTTEKVANITPNIERSTEAEYVENSTVSLFSESVFYEETTTVKHFDLVTNESESTSFVNTESTEFKNTESTVNELLTENNRIIYTDKTSHLTVIDDAQRKNKQGVAKTEEDLNQRNGNDLEVASSTNKVVTEKVFKIIHDIETTTEADNVAEPKVSAETTNDEYFDAVTKVNHTKSTVYEILTKNNKTLYFDTKSNITVIGEAQSEYVTTEHTLATFKAETYPRKGNDFNVASTTNYKNAGTSTEKVVKIAPNFETTTEEAIFESTTESTFSQSIVKVTPANKHFDVVTNVDHTESTIDELLTRNSRTIYSNSSSNFTGTPKVYLIDDTQGEKVESESEQAIVKTSEDAYHTNSSDLKVASTINNVDIGTTTEKFVETTPENETTISDIYFDVILLNSDPADDRPTINNRTINPNINSNFAEIGDSQNNQLTSENRRNILPDDFTQNRTTIEEPDADANSTDTVTDSNNHTVGSHSNDDVEDYKPEMFEFIKKQEIYTQKPSSQVIEHTYNDSENASKIDMTHTLTEGNVKPGNNFLQLQATQHNYTHHNPLEVRPISHPTASDKYFDVETNADNTESVVDEILTKSNKVIQSHTNPKLTVTEDAQSKQATSEEKQAVVLQDWTKNEATSEKSKKLTKKCVVLAAQSTNYTAGRQSDVKGQPHRPESLEFIKNQEISYQQPSSQDKEHTYHDCENTSNIDINRNTGFNELQPGYSVCKVSYHNHASNNYPLEVEAIEHPITSDLHGYTDINVNIQRNADGTDSIDDDSVTYSNFNETDREQVISEKAQAVVPHDLAQNKTTGEKYNEHTRNCNVSNQARSSQKPSSQIIEHIYNDDENTNNFDIIYNTEYGQVPPINSKATHHNQTSNNYPLKVESIKHPRTTNKHFNIESNAVGIEPNNYEPSTKHQSTNQSDTNLNLTAIQVTKKEQITSERKQPVPQNQTSFEKYYEPLSNVIVIRSHSNVDVAVPQSETFEVTKKQNISYQKPSSQVIDNIQNDRENTRNLNVTHNIEVSEVQPENIVFKATHHNHTSNDYPLEVRAYNYPKTTDKYIKDERNPVNIKAMNNKSSTKNHSITHSVIYSNLTVIGDGETKQVTNDQGQAVVPHHLSQNDATFETYDEYVRNVVLPKTHSYNDTLKRQSNVEVEDHHPELFELIQKQDYSYQQPRSQVKEHTLNDGENSKNLHITRNNELNEVQPVNKKNKPAHYSHTSNNYPLEVKAIQYPKTIDKHFNDEKNMDNTETSTDQSSSKNHSIIHSVTYTNLTVIGDGKREQVTTEQGQAVVPHHLSQNETTFEKFDEYIRNFIIPKTHSSNDTAERQSNVEVEDNQAESLKFIKKQDTSYHQPSSQIIEYSHNDREDTRNLHNTHNIELSEVQPGNIIFKATHHNNTSNNYYPLEVRPIKTPSTTNTNFDDERNTDNTETSNDESSTKNHSIINSVTYSDLTEIGDGGSEQVTSEQGPAVVSHHLIQNETTFEIFDERPRNFIMPKTHSNIHTLGRQSVDVDDHQPETFELLEKQDRSYQQPSSQIIEHTHNDGQNTRNLHITHNIEVSELQPGKVTYHNYKSVNHPLEVRGIENSRTIGNVELTYRIFRPIVQVHQGRKQFTHHTLYNGLPYGQKIVGLPRIFEELFDQLRFHTNFQRYPVNGPYTIEDVRDIEASPLTKFYYTPEKTEYEWPEKVEDDAYLTQPYQRVLSQSRSEVPVDQLFRERSKRFSPSLINDKYGDSLILTRIVRGSNVLSRSPSHAKTLTGVRRLGIRTKRSLPVSDEGILRSYGYNGDQNGYKHSPQVKYDYVGEVLGRNAHGPNGELVQILDLSGDSNVAQTVEEDGSGTGLLEVLGALIKNYDNSKILDKDSTVTFNYVKFKDQMNHGKNGSARSEISSTTEHTKNISVNAADTLNNSEIVDARSGLKQHIQVKRDDTVTPELSGEKEGKADENVGKESQNLLLEAREHFESPLEEKLNTKNEDNSNVTEIFKVVETGKDNSKTDGSHIHQAESFDVAHDMETKGSSNTHTRVNGEEMNTASEKTRTFEVPLDTPIAVVENINQPQSSERAHNIEGLNVTHQEYVVLGDQTGTVEVVNEHKNEGLTEQQSDDEGKYSSNVDKKYKAGSTVFTDDISDIISTGKNSEMLNNIRHNEKLKEADKVPELQQTVLTKGSDQAEFLEVVRELPQVNVAREIDERIEHIHNSGVRNRPTDFLVKGGLPALLEVRGGIDPRNTPFGNVHFNPHNERDHKNTPGQKFYDEAPFTQISDLQGAINRLIRLPTNFNFSLKQFGKPSSL